MEIDLLFVCLYSNSIGNVNCDESIILEESNNLRRDNLNNNEEQRFEQIATNQNQNTKNDIQETLYTIDEDIPIILCLDDVQPATTKNISTNEMAIIQSEESQPVIINLLECQEKSTTFEHTTVQMLDSPSDIVFDNLESQENNKNIQNISGE